MQIETGDYVTCSHSPDVVWGVVVRVITLPMGMGAEYDVATQAGLDHFTDFEIVADYGHTRSDHHEWTPEQKVQYDTLRHQGRRLYDQLRTRLALTHNESLSYIKVSENLQP